MTKEIQIPMCSWKARTTNDELCKHYVGVVVQNGELVGYHVVLVLTDAPLDYHEGYKVVRKFGNKYLIRAQESYKYETWSKIIENMSAHIRLDLIENIDNE